MVLVARWLVTCEEPLTPSLSLSSFFILALYIVNARSTHRERGMSPRRLSVSFIIWGVTVTPNDPSLLGYRLVTIFFDYLRYDETV